MNKSNYFSMRQNMSNILLYSHLLNIYSMNTKVYGLRLQFDSQNKITFLSMQHSFEVYFHLI